MGRLLRYLLILAVLAAAAGVTYALISDLPPPTREIGVELPPASLE